MDQEKPQAVAQQALEFMIKTGDEDTLKDLSKAAAAVTCRLDRAGATAVGRQALELLPKANGNQLWALAEVVAAVAEKGDAEATRVVATAFTRRTLELAPKAAANQLEALSHMVAAVAEKGDAETTRAATAAVVRRILELVPKAGQTRLVAFSKAVSAVAGCLDREAATAVTRRILELLPKADANKLAALSKMVSAVAEKGDAEATRATAAAVTRRALELLPEARDYEFWALVYAVRAVQDRVETTPQPEVAAELGRQLLLLNTYGGEEKRKSCSAVFDWLLHGTSDEALVDLLKHPACVGVMREAVLRELGRQHDRSFRSVWDAVAWLQQHRPDIDLNSPPRLARESAPGR